MFNVSVRLEMKDGTIESFDAFKIDFNGKTMSVQSYDSSFRNIDIDNIKEINIKTSCI